jgi:hypothetical protein
MHPAPTDPSGKGQIMNERIHRCLDGELPLEQLTAEELREMAELERIAADAAEGYRAIAAPDLAAGVMARLPQRAETSSGNDVVGAFFRDALGWLWTPRPIRLRPAYGFAAAAGVSALMLWNAGAATGGGFSDEAPAGSTTVTTAMAPGETGATGVARGGAHAAGSVFVQFRLDAPDAGGVRLAGSFTGWEPEHTLHQMAPGIWSILVPLEPGVHDYVFVVDGEEWVVDPAAPAVDDGFGGVNSRLSVLLPSGGAQS